MRGREVLPLQQHVGQLLFHGRDELVDERVVVVVADSPVAPAEVLRMFQQFDVVGAHVEDDRQRASGVDAADQGVQRQLPDRDAHPADALIAEAEDALAVGHDDHVRVAVRAVVDHLGKPVAIGIGHEEAPRPPVDLAEALTGLTDGRRVHDRHGLGDVLAEKSVEQRFVAVLQRSQVDVLVEIVTAGGELVPAVFDLLRKGLLCGRQETKEAVFEALLVGECGALCRQCVEQLRLPLRFVGHGGASFRRLGAMCPTLAG